MQNSENVIFIFEKISDDGKWIYMIRNTFETKNWITEIQIRCVNVQNTHFIILIDLVILLGGMRFSMNFYVEIFLKNVRGFDI